MNEDVTPASVLCTQPSSVLRPLSSSCHVVMSRRVPAHHRERQLSLVTHGPIHTDLHTVWRAPAQLGHARHHRERQVWLGTHGPAHHRERQGSLGHAGLHTTKLSVWARRGLHTIQTYVPGHTGARTCTPRRASGDFRRVHVKALSPPLLLCVSPQPR